MFNNKKDPLTDTIKDIMNRTALRNKVEEALNEQLGVSSRKAIPHEYLAQYDAMLAEQHAKAEKKTGTPTQTEGDKAEDASLKSKEDLPNPIADRLMNQGSYTSSAREGKAVPSLEKLQEKLSPKQEKLAAKAGDPNKIEDVDLKKLRKDKTLEEQQLQEKATEAQEEKVARVMREYKKGKLHSGSKEGKVTKKEQAVAIAMSQAGLSNKKKMDESFDALNEEIRNNLLEKLNSVYETYGEQAAQYAYDTLSEEERGILNEWGLSDIADAAKNWWNKSLRQPLPDMSGEAKTAEAPARPGTAARPASKPAARPPSWANQLDVGNSTPKAPSWANQLDVGNSTPKAPSWANQLDVGNSTASQPTQRAAAASKPPAPASSGSSRPTTTATSRPSTPTDTDRSPSGPFSQQPSWARNAFSGEGGPSTSEPSTTRSVRQSTRKEPDAFQRATKGDWSGTGDGGA